jgi:hypothetical protein
MAQTDSGKPLDAKSLTALVEELKGVVSTTALDEKNAALVAEKWDRRKDLAGKTKKDVINLLFEDVKSVIKDSGIQYQLYSMFSFYKQIPDELPSAQTAKTARPALPSDIAAAAGRDSDSLLKNPLIKARLKKLMGKQYASFMESFETLTPVKREGHFLFSSGCLIHACTHLESAIAINLTGNTIHAAIFRQDEKTRYFNEGGKATPKAIRNWANQLPANNQPPPMKSFLRQYSLKGKTVIPFNTNAGYGEGSSFQTVRELCPQSTVLEGFVTRGGLERDGQYLVIKEARAEEARKEVESWLRKIKMLQ